MSFVKGKSSGRPPRGIDLAVLSLSVLLATVVYVAAGPLAMSIIMSAAAGLYVTWRSR
jgi:hypothetical protein